jgi:hypothetical protein
MRKQKEVKMGNQPLKTWRSGNISGALWFNEREIKDGVKVGFKTVTLRRSWKDKKEVWRDETLSIRRQDLPKILTIVHQMMNELYLTEKEEAEGNE